MTAAVVGVKRRLTIDGEDLRRYSESSAANTSLTSTVPAAAPARKLVMVAVQYSAVPTQAGVTVTLDSGAGTAFDTILFTGTANAQSSLYFPPGDLIFGEDDAILVTAPAGGGVIVANVSAYTIEI